MKKLSFILVALAIGLMAKNAMATVDVCELKITQGSDNNPCVVLNETSFVHDYFYNKYLNQYLATMLKPEAETQAELTANTKSAPYKEKYAHCGLSEILTSIPSTPGYCQLTDGSNGSVSVIGFQTKDKPKDEFEFSKAAKQVPTKSIISSTISLGLGNYLLTGAIFLWDFVDGANACMGFECPDSSLNTYDTGWVTGLINSTYPASSAVFVPATSWNSYKTVTIVDPDDMATLDGKFASTFTSTATINAYASDYRADVEISASPGFEIPSSATVKFRNIKFTVTSGYIMTIKAGATVTLDNVVINNSSSAEQLIKIEGNGKLKLNNVFVFNTGAPTEYIKCDSTQCIIEGSSAAHFEYNEKTALIANHIKTDTPVTCYTIDANKCQMPTGTSYYITSLATPTATDKSAIMKLIDTTMPISKDSIIYASSSYTAKSSVLQFEEYKKYTCPSGQFPYLTAVSATDATLGQHIVCKAVVGAADGECPLGYKLNSTSWQCEKSCPGGTTTTTPNGTCPCSGSTTIWNGSICTASCPTGSTATTDGKSCACNDASMVFDGTCHQCATGQYKSGNTCRCDQTHGYVQSKTDINSCEPVAKCDTAAYRNALTNKCECFKGATSVDADTCACPADQTPKASTQMCVIAIKCTTDADCSSNETCTGNVCVEVVESVNLGLGATCVSDTECDANKNLICNGSKCSCDTDNLWIVNTAGDACIEQTAEEACDAEDGELVNGECITDPDEATCLKEASTNTWANGACVKATVVPQVRPSACTLASDASSTTAAGTLLFILLPLVGILFVRPRRPS